jgi:hypothetical protein
MGHFYDLPKDVVWLILRQTFLTKLMDWSMALTPAQLEQTNWLLLNDNPPTQWMCDVALINKLCLCVVEAKTFKKRVELYEYMFVWGFKRGALALAL